MTRGYKTSERKAAYHAFFAGMVLALYGIYSNSDLSALGVLIAAVVSPLIAYGGMRTALKRKVGENEGINS